MAAARLTLALVARELRRHHGEPAAPPSSDPFELILWEQVGYLASDERRKEAFELLRRRAGVTPARILKASPEALLAAAEAGGSIAAEERADRMRRSAELVRDRFEGDLGRVLGAPFPEARRALQKFPMIGEPGAEKILLFARAHPVLALESNGLRVLLRLGYGKEGRAYAASYRSVKEAVLPELRQDLDWLIGLHQLLRRHGQEVCKQTRPRCDACPLLGVCATGKAASTPRRRS
jgi:endonuclease III